MFDENAFGLLFEYLDIEADEYAEAATESFVDRFTLFERLVLTRSSEEPPAEPLQVTVLGHAIYLECEQEAAKLGLISWLKRLHSTLTEHSFSCASVLSHGGRWRSADAKFGEQRQLGAVSIVHLSLPSEPLRRALLAAAACHGAWEDEEGWGAGIYVDTEAIEALKLAPKNQPTLLGVAGAEFFRLGS
jgi:hypothetical protein